VISGQPALVGFFAHQYLSSETCFTALSWFVRSIEGGIILGSTRFGIAPYQI
jgi:hypothetical protein